MKVIFRSNNQLAKKILGQLGGAEEWLESLDRYVSDQAIGRLSLFIEENNLSLATLDIVDGSKHVHSSFKDKNAVLAVETVIDKCKNQLSKDKSKKSRETIRYNEEFNTSFDSVNEDVILKSSLTEQYDLLDAEKSLTNEKNTSRYNRIMNKYVNYLYRKNDIEQAYEHLRVLYSIYENADLEEMSVADYERLKESIIQIECEITSMLNKQKHFESGTKDEMYINTIIEKEYELAKLKK